MSVPAAGPEFIRGLPRLLPILFAVLGAAACRPLEAPVENALWMVERESRSLIALDRADGSCRVPGYLDRSLGPLALSEEGLLLGMDPVEHTLFEINPVNAVLDPLGRTLEATNPLSLCFSPSGRLYLLDDGQWILRLDPLSGRVLTRWQISPPGPAAGITFSPAVFEAPNGAVLDEGNLLAFLDFPGHTMLVYLELEDEQALSHNIVQSQPLRAVCGSRETGLLYALRREEARIYELSPADGILRPLLDPDCALTDISDMATR